MVEECFTRQMMGGIIHTHAPRSSTVDERRLRIFVFGIKQKTSDGVSFGGYGSVGSGRSGHWLKSFFFLGGGAERSYRDGCAGC